MSASYLHPWLIAVFMLLFALMSLVGMIRLIRERRVFGASILFLSVLIFGFSTWVAATLKV